jgi:flavin reductase (DIM6/NTAB) family NADH-FMN oxidoreductase RutF
MAEHAFDTLMAALDSPLIVVTTADQRERAGCLVEFHVQSSIEPQRYCVWLSKANYTYRVALQSSHLVIHFLTADDLLLAELFGTQTGDTVDKFAGLPVDSGPGGAPVLRQCPNWLAVRRIALLDEGGDHVCLTTEPVAVHTAGPFRPLWLSQVGYLKAGHGAGERPSLCACSRLRYARRLGQGRRRRRNPGWAHSVRARAGAGNAATGVSA